MPKEQENEAQALAAISPLLGDPAPRPLHGSKAIPGIFKGASAKEKAAAKVCIDNRWLEPTGEFTGKGKSKKELYKLGAAGLDAILKKSDPLPLIQGLNDTLSQLASKNEGLAQSMADSNRQLLEQMQSALATRNQELLTQLQASQAGMAAVQQAVQQALANVKPVDVSELMGKLAPTPPTVSGNGQDWLDEVVRAVTDQKQSNPFQRLTLPQLYQQLKASRPQLTLGRFHDGIRQLQDNNRIRLGPFTQALATLDDAHAPLFLDREVKYYVELP